MNIRREFTSFALLFAMSLSGCISKKIVDGEAADVQATNVSTVESGKITKIAKDEGDMVLGVNPTIKELVDSQIKIFSDAENGNGNVTERLRRDCWYGRPVPDINTVGDGPRIDLNIAVVSPGISRFYRIGQTLEDATNVVMLPGETVENRCEVIVDRAVTIMKAYKAGPPEDSTPMGPPIPTEQKPVARNIHIYARS